MHLSTKRTFTYQSKFTKELIVKFGLKNAKSISTPLNSTVILGPDDDGNTVDETKYHGKIGTLPYLIAHQPDILFIVCKYATF